MAESDTGGGWAQQLQVLLEHLADSGELGKYPYSSDALDYEVELAGKGRCHVQIEIDRRLDVGEHALAAGNAVGGGVAEGSAGETGQQSIDLFETLAQGVVYQDAGGAIFSANPAAQRMLGLSLEEMEGRTPADARWRAIHEDGSPFPAEGHPAMLALARGEPGGEVIMGVFNPREQAHRWLLVSAVPQFRAGDSRPFQVCTTFSDITELRRAESALRESEERYRTLYECAGDGIFLMQADRWVDCNRKTLEMFGCTREQLLGRRPLDFSPMRQPDGRDSEEVAREMGRRALAGEAPTFEWQHRRLDGTLFDVKVTLTGVRIAGEFQVLALLKDITARKRAERALRESEERFRDIVESSPMGVHVWELQPDGRLVFAGANQAADTILGLDHRQFLGQTIEEAFPPLAGTEVPERYRQVAATGQAWKTEEVQYEDERIRGAFEVHAFQISPGVAAAMFFDITERKRAQEGLRRSEELFRSHFELGLIGMAFLSPAGRWLQVNQGLCDILGYSRDELLSRTWNELTDPADRAGEEAELEQVLAGETDAYSMEKRLIRKDGHTAYTESRVRAIRREDGSIMHIIAYLLDMTERKHAEVALRESERRLRELLETVQLMAVMLDTSGNITFCNDYLLRLTGRPVEEVMGKNWFDTFIPAGEREKVEGVFRRAITASDFPAHFENAILTREGGRRMVEWDNTVLRDPAGNVVGTASLGRDVTEHLALEAQYRQAQRLESIGRLAGGVAHDFNNLLTVISGYAELLLRMQAENDPARACVLEICTAGERAAALTRQLLAFSRRQALQLMVLNLNEMVVEAQRMLQRIIGEDIELIVRLDPGLGQVRADAGQIHQVLMNLAVNARDAMPQGGKLTIESANAEMPASGAGSRVAAGAWVRLSVTDSGCGMSEEVKAHLFEPFFTTKERGKGTGLGLSTVYGIIRQSGGQVLVDSAPGVGTTFGIFLPRIPAPVAEADGRQAEPAMQRGTETILLVEDHQEVRELAAGTLRGCGYRVLTAANGAEALRVSEGHAGEIPMLVSDVVMPGINGFELADRLRMARPGIRTLYMSGYAARAITEHGGLPPDTVCLQKPFSPPVLAQRVREMLDEPRAQGSVLVMGGEPLSRALLRQVLSHAGYEVADAGTGTEALAAMEKQRADVVITDLGVAGQEVLGAVQAIRQQHAGVQVIAISEELGEEALRAAAALGARETLAKPVALGDVLRAVEEALASGSG